MQNYQYIAGRPDTNEIRSKCERILNLIVDVERVNVWLEGTPAPKALTHDQMDQIKKIDSEFDGWPAWFYAQVGSRVNARKFSVETVHPTLQYRGVNQYLSYYYASKQDLEEKIIGVPKQVCQPKVVIVADPVIMIDADPCFNRNKLSSSRDNFVRDVVFFFSSGDKKFLPSNEASLVGIGMNRVALSQEAAASFLTRTSLSEGLKREMSTQVYYDYLVASIGTLSSQDFLKIVTTFYMILFQVQSEPRPNGQLVFKVPPEFGLARTKEGAMVRVGKYLDPVKKEPATLKDRVQFLMHERTIRGEDSQRSNYFSQFSGRGAFATKERMLICDILSLAYPYRTSHEVHVLVPGAVSEKLMDFIRDQNLSFLKVVYTDSFSPNLRRAQSVFLSEGKEAISVSTISQFLDTVVTTTTTTTTLTTTAASTSAVTTRTSLVEADTVQGQRPKLLIDFRGTALLSNNKKINYEQQWADMIKRHISVLSGYQFWISKVKLASEIFPLLPDYRYFKLHSAHAFDLLMTTLPELSRVVKIYRAYPVERSIAVADPEERIVKLDRVNPGSWNSVVFRDSRIRTWSFLNKDYGEIDFGLNLYGGFINSSKADLKYRSRLLAEYQQPVELSMEAFAGTNIQAFVSAVEPEVSVQEVDELGSRTIEVTEGEKDDDHEVPVVGSDEV